MRDLRARGAGAVLALVLGALGLMSVLPLLSLAAGACIAPIPVLAPVGLHLDLLSPLTAGCPEHSFLPGTAFGPTIQFLVLLFTTTAATGASHLLLAFGVGVWVARSLRAVHDWLHVRLAPTTPTVLRLAFAPPAPGEPIVAALPLNLYRAPLRRGPPASH